MYRATENYGKVYMNSYLPSFKAVTYLNYFLSVGWHNCNTKYHPIYKDGTDGTLLLFTIGGCGILKQHNKTSNLSAGSIAIIPAGTPMEYFTCPQQGFWEFYWITLGGSYAQSMCLYIIETCGAVSLMPIMTACIPFIKELIEIDIPTYPEWQISHNICALLGTLSKELLKPTAAEKEVDLLSKQVISFVDQHYAEELCLSHLCKKFYLSKNQLIRVFHRQTGYTPHEYLKQHRLLKASELLRMSEKSIKEISSLTGFSSPSHFISQFRSQYGMTPKTYRKNLSPILTYRSCLTHTKEQMT